jgi:predicted nucleic acid-binding protein
MKLRIYLDVCCLNRPFDDLRQDRIRLEAEAIKAILRRIDDGIWVGVKSPAVKFEISRMSDMDRMLEVGLISARMKASVSQSSAVRVRARELEQIGFGGVDALHLAFAEKAKADVFLTTDDGLLRRAVRYKDVISVSVDNPLRWIERMV